MKEGKQNCSSLERFLTLSEEQMTILKFETQSIEEDPKQYRAQDRSILSY